MVFLVKTYEINADKLYSREKKRKMTLDDLNKSNSELNWNDFHSGEEGKIRSFVETYNSFVDKINNGEAPRIHYQEKTPKELRDRYMQIAKKKIVENTYETIKITGSQENVNKLKEEYFNKDLFGEQVLGRNIQRNYQKKENKEQNTIEEKDTRELEEKVMDIVKDELHRQMLFNLFNKSSPDYKELSLSYIHEVYDGVKAKLTGKTKEITNTETKKKQYEEDIGRTTKDKQNDEDFGKVIPFIPSYLFFKGQKPEFSNLEKIKYVN